MADISTWSPIADDNDFAPPDGWPEGQMPSTVNNCARELMAAVRRWYDDTVAGTLVLPYLPLAGGVVTGNVQINGTGGLTLSGTQLRQIAGGLEVYNPAGGAVASRGPGAAFSFGDRDLASPSWAWYAFGGVSRLSNGSDLVAVSGAGRLTVANSIDTLSYDIGGVALARRDGLWHTLVDQSAAPSLYLGGAGSSYYNLYRQTNHSFEDRAGGVYFRLTPGAATSHVALTLNVGASAAGHATRKDYVDAQDQDIIGYVNSQDAAYSALTVSKAGDTMTGALTVPYINGGANNAGTLRTYGDAYSVCFRWDPGGAVGQLEYRVDEYGPACRFISDTLNVFGTQYAYPGGGPTSAVFAGHDYPGNWYYAFIDYLSDERIKSGIGPTQIDALAVLRQVPVNQYDVDPEVAGWYASIGKDEGERARVMADAGPVHVPIGFVAQSIKDLIPEAVYVRPGEEPEGSPLPQGAHNIVMQAFVPHLVRAVQQLAARVETLEGGN